MAWPPAFAHAGSKLKRSALTAGDECRNSGARAEIVEKRTMTPAGLERAIPGLVGRCLIHWATGPLAPKKNGAAQGIGGILPTYTCGVHPHVRMPALATWVPCLTGFAPNARASSTGTAPGFTSHGPRFDPRCGLGFGCVSGRSSACVQNVAAAGLLVGPPQQHAGAFRNALNK